MWIGIVLIVLIGLFFLLVRFTTVEEGEAKAIKAFGKFQKVIFQWEDHWIDEEWNIWKQGEDSGGKREKKVRGRIIGGLWFYGIWPIHKIHRYKHRWTDIRIRETGKMDVEFHEKELDHVLLKPAVYATKLFAVETAPPERIPVDVLILITLRIKNPYLFLFVAPPTPIEDVLARIGAEMRGIIANLNLDALFRIKGESLWREKKEESEEKLEEKSLLAGAKVIEETLEKWGMKLADKGIEIRDIDLSPEYQKTMAARRTQEALAAARAAETVGTVIEMMAASRGKEPDDIKKEIDANPEMKKEFLDLAKDLIIRKMGIEGGSYVDIRVQGAEGFERTLLNSLALWRKMSKEIQLGRKKEEEEKEPEAKKEGVKMEEENLTTAEKEVIAEAKKRGIDPREPLEKWRQFVKEKEEKKKKRKEKWGF